jgi:protein SCO1/2
MKELQDQFIGEKDLRLVSITVDPKRDTARVLSEYANRFGANPEHWSFLTGEKEAIYRLAQQGFLLGAAEIAQEKRPPSGATHTHSPRFVLVDRKAQIRGYYTSTDAEVMVRQRRDLKNLLRSGE